MTFVALAALAVLGIWVLAPIFGNDSRTAPMGARSLDDLLEAKQAVYRRLLDLKMDHETGKLSSSDYLFEKAEAESEAAQILNEMDHEFATDLLELEIAAAREQLQAES